MTRIKRITKWKPGSFQQVPPLIEHNLLEITEEIYFGGARLFTAADLKSGELSHLGVSIKADKLVIASDEVVPFEMTGPYSYWNQKGREIVRKDLAKIEKTIEWEGLAYGKYPVTMSRLVKCFQKERRHGNKFSFAPFVLTSEEVEEESVFVLGCRLNAPLKRTDANFQAELLFRLSLLQENFGAVNVLPSNSDNKALMEMVSTNWQLLPPELRTLEVARLFGKTNLGEGKKLIERLQFIKSECPGVQILTGTDGLAGYFLAKISETCVIAENLVEGNAIYVFGSDWRRLTKLSRTRLQSHHQDVVQRILHKSDGGWRENIATIIRKHKTG